MSPLQRVLADQKRTPIQRIFTPRESPTIARRYAQDDHATAKRFTAGVAFLGAQIVGLYTKDVHTGSTRISKNLLHTIPGRLDAYAQANSEATIAVRYDARRLKAVAAPSFSGHLFCIEASGKAGVNDRSAIASISILAGRRHIAYHINQSPFAWTFHAAARLYERAHDKIASADRVIVAQIEETYPLLAAILAASRPGDMIGLPVAGGLLIGFVDRPERPGHNIAVVPTARDRNKEPRSALRYAPSWNDAFSPYAFPSKDKPFDPHNIWLASTFFGPNEIKRRHEAYIDAFNGLARRLPVPMALADRLAPALYDCEFDGGREPLISQDELRIARAAVTEMAGPIADLTDRQR
jgi:hypothetical protein